MESEKTKSTAESKIVESEFYKVMLELNNTKARLNLCESFLKDNAKAIFGIFKFLSEMDFVPKNV